MDALIPRKVTITIPDGHAGLTGIAIAFGHNAVIPSNAGAYITGNDWTFPFDLHNYPNGVAWSAFVCNLDLQPHSWQVIFEGDNLTSTDTSAIPQVINTGDLAALQAAPTNAEAPSVTTG